MMRGPPTNVIASQRVGAKRRPMTGSAKQSSYLSRAKLDCFVASLLAMTMGGRRYAPRAISRTSPTVSSIMSAVTSRWVQAQNPAVHHRQQHAALAQAATMSSPLTPVPSGLKNTRLVSGCCTSMPLICERPRASARALA